MVEVEGEAHNEGSTEERMVGVDLCKGVILEIQITTGKTFAKHNLGRNSVLWECYAILNGVIGTPLYL